jgi:hypothetical protein
MLFAVMPKFGTENTEDSPESAENRQTVVTHLGARGWPDLPAVKGCLTGLLNSQETAEKRVLVNSQRTKDERKRAHGSYGGHYTARQGMPVFFVLPRS